MKHLLNQRVRFPVDAEDEHGAPTSCEAEGVIIWVEHGAAFILRDDNETDALALDFVTFLDPDGVRAAMLAQSGGDT